MKLILVDLYETLADAAHECGWSNDPDLTVFKNTDVTKIVADEATAYLSPANSYVSVSILVQFRTCTCVRF